MANKYTGTKTEKNLWEAFAGESQARNKYTYFASVAKKAGFEQIAEIFLKTWSQEARLHHRRRQTRRHWQYQRALRKGIPRPQRGL